MISADLGQQLESFVAGLVATGRYNSKSEVLREGVRLIQDREARLVALDASIARGLADADAGRTKPIYAGLDVSDKATHVCVVDAEGAVLRRESWLQGQPVCHSRQLRKSQRLW